MICICIKYIKLKKYQKSLAKGFFLCYNTQAVKLCFHSNNTTHVLLIGRAGATAKMVETRQI